MGRYDVYRAPDGVGWLLDVQADVLDGLNTRVVVPLLPAPQAPKPARRLNPVLLVEGREAIMVTQFMSAVPQTLLRAQVGNLGDRGDEVALALDMLFSGF
mgnify:CR=1 FL=1